MNILFLSIMDMVSLKESNIYSDLVSEFIKNGHHVDIISPIEKRSSSSDADVVEPGYCIYKPHVGNITNTGFVEKGFSILKYRRQIVRCIKEKIGEKHIDLFLVAVPPLTVDTVVAFVKRRYKCPAYLLLKDIWPASMFDLKTVGGPIVKKAVCSVFRVWEKHLYRICDSIGCLSQANVDYILKNNPYLRHGKVHVNPNSITPHDIKPLSEQDRNGIRARYGIPFGKTAFIYGGTLGVGQNVKHIVECMKACRDEDCHFVISGRGVQYDLLAEYQKEYAPDNLTLINGLPKQEYDMLMQSCDVGMVFLRYTAQTPNIPSRILTYMDYSLPILSCTDPVSDLNGILEDGAFGWGCLSSDPMEFKALVERILKEDIGAYSKRSREYLERNYSACESFRIIMENTSGTAEDGR